LDAPLSASCAEAGLSSQSAEKVRPRYRGPLDLELGLIARGSNDGQTEEQARNFRILSFQCICGFEGLPVPSDEAVAAEIDRRGPRLNSQGD
jgi:hypothetical protein